MTQCQKEPARDKNCPLTQHPGTINNTKKEGMKGLPKYDKHGSGMPCLTLFPISFSKQIISKAIHQDLFSGLDADSLLSKNIKVHQL